MKKFIVFAALMVLGTTLIGCKASADVDPHGSTAVSLPR
jgi:hypothetical protein